MKTEEHIAVNRTYKATLFHKLFGQNKENALCLYNAMNGTNYTLEDDFEYTMLEDVVYMKAKDDVSFMVGTSLNLYEHQSTYNPNMPLRGLLYFSSLYRKMIAENERLYSTTMLKIPNPKFVVFYNGKSERVKNDVEKLRLSDAFFEKDETGEFEWTATMVNINIGHNKELFKRCKVLEQYSIFVDRVRMYNDSMNDLNAHKDRHEKIGQGHLGIDAITRIINHPALKDKPFILETPNDEAGYAKEIALLKSLSN